jgi:hypothetical protein
MYHYFTDCQSLEEAKSLYKKLARQHHPDLGGDTRTMQEINAQYATFQANFVRTSERARQQQAHAEGKKTAADYHDLDEVAETLRVKIEAVLNMGLDVELCGLWLWVTGDTKPHKEELKALGFRWSPHKTAWYYPAVPSFNRIPRSMDDIRQMHGSMKFVSPNRDEESPNPQPLPA